MSAPIAALPAGVKLKALALTPLNGQGSDLFGADFGWTTGNKLKTQVDLAVALGANAVKPYDTPWGAMIAGGSAATTAAANMNQFLTYTSSLGLYVYWPFFGDYAVAAGYDAAQIAAAVTGQLAVLETYPLVIGYDVVNEINFPGTVTTAEGIAVMNICSPIMRSLTNRPIGYSLSVQAASEFGGSWAETTAPYVDFQDFHYYYFAASNNPVPDVTTYYYGDATARPRAPYLMGESGIGAAAGSGEGIERWTGAGALAADPHCAGAVGFCLADYAGSGSGDYGIYEADLTTERSYLATVFATWPNTY